ncbi:MAG: DUF1801 domain-containing protein [Fimbriimonadaceae bacterium]
MTSDELIQTWPEEWQETVRSLVASLRQSMPAGYEERCDGKMIHWVIPHSLYPAGYHCDPKSALPYLSLTVTKSGFSVYNFGMYMLPMIADDYRAAYEAKASRKADMGKSCIKFKRPDHVRIDPLADLIAQVTPATYIAHYTPLDPRNR